MNIESKINKKEETVLVSNENGNLKELEYQDNIDEILKLENVIENLENILVELKEEQAKTCKNITELQETIIFRKRANIQYLLWYLVFIFGGTTLGFLYNMSYTISNLFLLIAENLQNIEVLKDVLFGGGIGLAYTIYSY